MCHQRMQNIQLRTERPQKPATPPQSPGRSAGRTYQTGLEHQLPSLHGNLVGVGQRGAEGEDELVGEDLQRPGLSALVDGDGFPAHPQPQLQGEHPVTRLRAGKKQEEETLVSTCTERSQSQKRIT